MKTREEIKYEAAKKQVKRIRGFYVHLSIYILVNILIFVADNYNEGLIAAMQDLSNYISAGLWGIGLAAHGTSVFAPDIFFGKKWEEKKIKELMDQENQNRWE